MKILILGAGVTGSAVASALASEENDIMVVDYKPHLLEALKERFDIATVVGNAAHPSVLEQAGINDTDIVIAVTDSDETTMLACLIIKCLAQPAQNCRPGQGHRLFETSAIIRRQERHSHRSCHQPGNDCDGIDT